MGLSYTLVNIDKQQRIGFHNIDTGAGLRELSGTVIASAIITYYFLTNSGDRIGFVNDRDSFVSVCGQCYEQRYLNDFVDVTEQVVDALIIEGVLKDKGVIWIDKEEGLYYRNLMNIWDPTIRL